MPEQDAERPRRAWRSASVGLVRLKVRFWKAAEMRADADDHERVRAERTRGVVSVGGLLRILRPGILQLMIMVPKQRHLVKAALTMRVTRAGQLPVMLGARGGSGSHRRSVVDGNLVLAP